MTTFQTTSVSMSTTPSVGLGETYPAKIFINNSLIESTDFNNSEINQILQSILYSTLASNNTTIADDDGTDLMQNITIQAFFSIFYILFFVLGIFGNSLVCFVVFRQRTMQTVTNFFITNLAIADILLCLLCVPFTPLYTFMGTWVFGSTLCFIVSFAQGCCVYLSTLTLTSIAIDRFFVIIFPFRPRMKIRTCILIIIFIWIVACALTFPYGLYMTLVKMHYMNAERTLCEERVRSYLSDIIHCQ
jgi:neuropeptide Y receptor